MQRFDDMLKEPTETAKLLFWIGGILSGLSIIFYAFQADRVDLFNEIQMPFGLLFVILVALIIMVLVFILTNIYNLLRGQESLGYFTPVTRALIILMLLAIITSTAAIGQMVYLIVRVASTGG